MELIGKSVPHRHACVLGKLLHYLLTEAPVLYSVKHSAKNPCCICDALLLAYLAALGIQVCGTHTKVVSSYLEGASGSGTGLLEDECHILAAKLIHQYSLLLHIFKIRCQIHKIFYLFRCVIKQFKKVSAL